MDLQDLRAFMSHEFIQHCLVSLLQDDVTTVEIFVDCTGDYELIFLGVRCVEYFLLALFSTLVAFQTQKNIGIYFKHLESAVINLTTILAVLLSSVCQVVLIIFHLNDQQEGVLLLITLRNCLWMFPMIYLLFIPKVQLLHYV